MSLVLYTGKYWGYIGHTLGLYWVYKGIYWGSMEYILGYILGLYCGYVGVDVGWIMPRCR